MKNLSEEKKANTQVMQIGRMILGYQKMLYKSRYGITLMFLGGFLIGLSTGFGPLSIAQPDQMTVFGPEILNFSLGQWIFSISGLSLAIAGAYISDFE